MTVAGVLIALLVGAACGVLVGRAWWGRGRRLEPEPKGVAPAAPHARGEVELPKEVAGVAAALLRMTDAIRGAREETAAPTRSPERPADETEELRGAWRRMVRLGQMLSLGELAAAVAHELNNPLTAVVTYARFVERELEESDLPPEKREELSRCLSQVQKDARRCGDIAGNLLLFSRPAGGARSVDHLNRIIESGLHLVRHRLETGRIDLDAEPLAGDDSIACDGSLLQLAFVALVLDAAAAMPGGGRLTVRAAPADHTVRIEISRADAGTAAGTARPPVEPVATPDESPGRLGLLIAYGIVRQHAGEIEIESVPGGETTVRLLLPRTAAAGGPMGA